LNRNFGTGANQSVGIVSGRDVLTILLKGYGKKLNLSSFFAKLFASNPKTSVSVILRLTNTRLTASPENNSVKNEMTELGLSPVHLKD